MADMSLQTTYTKLPTFALIGSTMLGAKYTTFKNSHASASLSIGSPVVWRTSGATSDKDVLPPSTSADLVCGIIVRDDEHGRAWTDENGTHGQLDATGLAAGTLMNCIRVGLIYVACITGCKPGDRLFTSYTAGGPYTAAGQFGNATQASTTLDNTTKAEWRSTAAAAGSAWLEVDFVSK